MSLDFPILFLFLSATGLGLFLDLLCLLLELGLDLLVVCLLLSDLRVLGGQLTFFLSENFPEFLLAASLLGFNFLQLLIEGGLTIIQLLSESLLFRLKP